MAKKRIFVADDQEEVLSLLKDFLTGEGFEVMVSKESKNVLRLIRSFKPNLILLDLLMPDLGGFDVCEILNNEPQTRGIPIIVISGLSAPEDIKKSYRLGVVDYLVKPFSLPDMLAKINKAICNKETPF
ncbi:MAG: DNA-binding response regulator MtrA [Candidatus Omnitrophica bacterium ADurb.Bin205]|nr:MAG: DNA-binding response regulator MtrA [Candidatus Omnitrophica bacterium ADurb.Bin205]